MKQVPPNTEHTTGQAVDWCWECKCWEDPSVRFPSVRRKSAVWWAMKREMRETLEKKMKRLRLF